MKITCSKKLCLKILKGKQHTSKFSSVLELEQIAVSVAEH